MSLSRTSIEPEQTLHLKRNQNNTASTAPISGFFNVLKQRRQWKGSIHGICNNLPRHSRMQVNEQPQSVSKQETNKKASIVHHFRTSLQLSGRPLAHTQVTF